MDPSSSADESKTQPQIVTGIQFPAYDVAARGLLQKVFEAKRLAQPVLGRIDLMEKDHAGPIRSVGGEKPFDSPMKMHSGAGSISIDDLENRSFAAYAKMIQTMAEDLLESLARTYFGEIRALTAHVGNVVDGAGKSLFEQLKEGMMNVAIYFDDDGNLVPKQLVVHPDVKDAASAALAQVLSDPEVQAHVEAERQKFLQSRPRRRVLSPC
ncbi:MAG TPA: hypothetical protein VHX17_06535 [Candidatus Cybelea sp.]|jgi:hypothetical protein|nr:hypothetical protein [Candidatus Cybelea sp.]